MRCEIDLTGDESDENDAPAFHLPSECSAGDMYDADMVRLTLGALRCPRVMCRQYIAPEGAGCVMECRCGSLFCRLCFAEFDDPQAARDHYLVARSSDPSAQPCRSVCDLTNMTDEDAHLAAVENAGTRAIYTTIADSIREFGRPAHCDEAFYAIRAYVQRLH